MSWYAVYQLEDGRLVSGTGDPDQVAAPEILTSRGYGVAERPDGEQTGVWNPATLRFDPRPPEPVWIGADEFLDLFSAAEVARCFACPEPNLQKMLRRLQMRFEPLDLLSETVAQGLGLIAMLGLFDDQAGQPGAPTDRPAAILAWRP
ncbi:MAG TPA: hypothetical protein VEC60_18825 [Reyranella sp.]|nr:hypothetical protein [Reyranella sp.]